MFIVIEAVLPEGEGRAGYYSLSKDTGAATLLEAAGKVAKEFGHMFWCMGGHLSRMKGATPARWELHQPRELRNFIRLIEAVQTVATGESQSSKVATLLLARLRSHGLLADIRAVCVRLRDIDRGNTASTVQAGDDVLFETASRVLKEFANPR